MSGRRKPRQTALANFPRKIYSSAQKASGAHRCLPSPHSPAPPLPRPAPRQLTAPRRLPPPGAAATPTSAWRRAAAPAPALAVPAARRPSTATAEGRARIAAARTIHGRCSAEWRAHNRRILSFARRGRLFLSVMRYLDRLPPDLAARFRERPQELGMPPYLTGGLTVAHDRAIQRAEAEALAPWKAAIALARQAGPARPDACLDDRGAAHAKAHAPVPPICDHAAPGAARGSDNAHAVAKPHAPERAAAADRAAADRATPAALRAAPVTLQAKPLAPERSATGDRAVPVAPRATPVTLQAKPLAPERSAARDRAVPAAPQAAPVTQQAKPLAPERAVAGDRAIPAAPQAAAATPQAKPLAPERATPMAGAVPVGLTCRAAHRWKRQQKRMHQRPPASPRA
jgi:hypothetical protein